MTDHAPEDDDQHWFDLMAGRAVADAHGRTRGDAAWLRAALLAYRAVPPAGQMPDPQARAARLVARARGAGVLPPAPAARAGWRQRLFGQRAARWPARWPTWSGAALALMLAVGLGWRGGDAPLDDTAAPLERGPAEQRLTDADPAARQQALLQGLRAAGFEALPFERLGRRGVEVVLPVPLTPPQRQALHRLGLRPPEGPGLVVEIVPAP